MGRGTSDGTKRILDIIRRELVRSKYPLSVQELRATLRLDGMDVPYNPLYCMLKDAVRRREIPPSWVKHDGDEWPVDPLPPADREAKRVRKVNRKYINQLFAKRDPGRWIEDRRESVSIERAVSCYLYKSTGERLQFAHDEGSAGAGKAWTGEYVHGSEGNDYAQSGYAILCATTETLTASTAQMWDIVRRGANRARSAAYYESRNLRNMDEVGLDMAAQAFQSGRDSPFLTAYSTGQQFTVDRDPRNVQEDWGREHGGGNMDGLAHDSHKNAGFDNHSDAGRRDGKEVER